MAQSVGGFSKIAMASLIDRLAFTNSTHPHYCPHSHYSSHNDLKNHTDYHQKPHLALHASSLALTDESLSRPVVPYFSSRPVPSRPVPFRPVPGFSNDLFLFLGGDARFACSKRGKRVANTPKSILRRTYISHPQCSLTLSSPMTSSGAFLVEGVSAARGAPLSYCYLG